MALNGRTGRDFLHVAPGPLGLMRAIATRLSPAEFDAVAQYFGAIEVTTATKGKQ
ncbi:MAG: hypothetical protein JSS46_00965 [Proteobacteria bacterium]|jgi:cytochrome c553|nr:hypothetical protein [Pseudomonadota bacterium]